MPRGFSAKREREYEEIERKIEKEHRYPGREEEVAARIVNKQRAKSGETKSSKRGGKKSSGSKSSKSSGSKKSSSSSRSSRGSSKKSTKSRSSGKSSSSRGKRKT